MNKLTVDTDIALKAPQLSTRAIGVTIANEETATVVTSWRQDDVRQSVGISKEHGKHAQGN